MPPRRRLGRPDALARSVLDRYLGVRRGETVVVESWSHALPWARALVVEARRRGATPTLIVEDEAAYFQSLAAVGAAALARHPSPPPNHGGAHIYLDGPEEYERLLGVPPADRERLLARFDVRWWSEARRLRTRAIRLAVADATPTAARRLGVDRDAWETELVRASLVDPARLAASGSRLVDALGRSVRLRVRHANGTDLVVGRSDRPPFVDAGIPDPSGGAVWAQVPSGVVIVPLRPGATAGRWETNRPSHDRFVDPPIASGGRFTFRHGRLTHVDFDRGGEPFDPAVGRSGRGRLRALALTVGVNPVISHAPGLGLLSEGALGLLIGDRPYRPSGERPGFSFVALLADADVHADGRAWIRGGRPARHGDRPTPERATG